MEIYDIVNKLIGPISPIGKCEVDEARYENLEQWIALTDGLLDRIAMVAAANADRVEASMRKAGVRCAEFMAEVSDTCAQRRWAARD